MYVLGVTERITAPPLLYATGQGVNFLQTYRCVIIIHVWAESFLPFSSFP